MSATGRSGHTRRKRSRQRCGAQFSVPPVISRASAPVVIGRTAREGRKAGPWPCFSSGLRGRASNDELHPRGLALAAVEHRDLLEFTVVILVAVARRYVGYHRRPDPGFFL